MDKYALYLCNYVIIYLCKFEGRGLNIINITAMGRCTPPIGEEDKIKYFSCFVFILKFLSFASSPQIL